MIIKLQRNLETVIDDEDYDLVKDYHWRANYNSDINGYYVVAHVKQPNGCWTTLFLHRLIMHAVKGMQVDHINRDPLNNRKKNLRFCNRSQNKCNSDKQSNNTTGFKGVVFRQAVNKFQARVSKDCKRYDLGHFNTAQEASEAYERAAKELHGEFYYRAIEVN